MNRDRKAGWLLVIGGVFSFSLSMINTLVPISWHVSYYICRVLDHGLFLAAGSFMAQTRSEADHGRNPGIAIMLYGGIGMALYVYGALDNVFHLGIDTPRATLVYLLYGMLLVAGIGLAARRSLHPTKLPGWLLMTYAIYQLAVEIGRDIGLEAAIDGLASVDERLPVMITGTIYFVQIALVWCIVATGVIIVRSTA